MRVTARGVAVFLAGAALCLAGLTLGYRELTLIGCAAITAFAAALLVVAQPWSLRIDRIVAPRRVTRDAECRGVVTLGNASRWRGIDMVATDRCAMPTGDVDIPVPVLRLPRGGTQTVYYTIPTHRRGVIDIGPLTLRRRDIFHLARVSRDVGDTYRVWVHPPVRDLGPIPAGAARSLDGHIDAVAAGSIMFHALREYVPGDDLRHIHWRTSARVGTLMVREHVDTSLPRVVILLDDREGACDTDAFETAVEITASIVAAALRDNLTVDLHTVSGRSLDAASVGLGPAETLPLFLDLLAEVTTGDSGRPAFAEATQRLRQRRSGDTLVLLTGAAGAAELDLVAGLRDVFPSMLCGVFTDDQPAGTTSKFGALVISAPNAEQFAAQWNGVGAW